MKVKLDQDWKVSPNGYDVKEYSKGDILEGPLAERAIDCGVGKQVRADAGEKRTNKPKKTPKPKETKPTKPEHEG